MKNLAIIPARGGSKRIPRKNIREFLGIPIISYAIAAALDCELFEEVMVSTDDEEIAAAALHFGAKVPFMRTMENADDHATTFDVVKEVLFAYQAKGENFENCCCIYPCAPFVTEKKLSQGYEKMQEGGFDSVFPVVPYTTPIQRALALREEKVAMFYPKFAKVRSQDLEPAYFDAGQFYWMKIGALLAKKAIITKNSGCIVLNQMDAQDIDNEEDWELAEIKYRLMKQALL